MTTTHTIDVEAERQDFEQDLIAECKAQGDSDEYITLILERNSRNGYPSTFVQARFDGWLAAKRSIQPTIAAEDVRDAQEILRELVESHALKAEYDAAPHMHHVAWFRKKLFDYQSRWAAAWSRAIAATTTPKGEA